MAVVETFPDRSYSWRCDDCGAERKEYPHRGPRKSVCKRCQNLRYLARRPLTQVEFDRAGAAGAAGHTASAGAATAGKRGRSAGGAARAPFRLAVPPQGGGQVPVVRSAVLAQAAVDVLDVMAAQLILAQTFAGVPLRTIIGPWSLGCCSLPLRSPVAAR